MHIIIVGCGKVGSTLAEQLQEEDTDLTLIDTDADVINNLTADNCGIWKHLAEFFTALFVLVNDLNTDLQIRKGFGKIIGNCAAANDQSIFDLMCLQPNLFKEKSCIFGCCDNRDKIAIVNQMITARDA